MKIDNFEFNLDLVLLANCRRALVGDSDVARLSLLQLAVSCRLRLRPKDRVWCSISI